jgi:hypothetical protein
MRRIQKVMHRKHRILFKLRMKLQLLAEIQQLLTEWKLLGVELTQALEARLLTEETLQMRRQPLLKARKPLRQI